jgi:hypothetical protein
MEENNAYLADFEGANSSDMGTTVTYVDDDISL